MKVGDKVRHRIYPETVPYTICEVVPKGKSFDLKFKGFERFGYFSSELYTLVKPFNRKDWL